jgi:hydrogenase nickel incorporation protein HypA/HybF
MQDMLTLAAQQARQAGGQRIHRVMMRVGALSGVVSETLVFAFDVLKKDTMADAATLEIEAVPLVCYCHQCAAEFTPTDLICECPQCHEISTDLRSGREVELTSLEVS